MSETAITKTNTQLALKMDLPLGDTAHLKNMSDADMMVIADAFPDVGLSPQDKMAKARTMVSQFALYIDNLDKPEPVLRCITQSIAECMLTLASLDLPLTKSLGYAALIPYSGVCTVQLMYQGLCELIYRTKAVSSIQCGIVYKGDQFAYELGTNPALRCIRGDGEATEANLTHAWALARNNSGPDTIEVMERADLDRVKGASKMSNGPAWKYWWGQMYRKAPIRRMAKYLQTSIVGAGQAVLARGLEMENSQYDVGRIEHYKGVRQEHSKQLMDKASESLGAAPKALPPPGDIPAEVQEIKDRMKAVFGNAECARVAKTVSSGGIIRTLDEARAFEKILNAGTAEDGDPLPPEYQ